MPKEYNMEYLVAKAKEYSGPSEECWSHICKNCGKTYGNHFSTSCNMRGYPPSEFVEDKEATEFFVALKQIVKFGLKK
jgi:hypothetical protein